MSRAGCPREGSGSRAPREEKVKEAAPRGRVEAEGVAMAIARHRAGDEARAGTRQTVLCHVLPSGIPVLVLDRGC